MSKRDGISWNDATRAVIEARLAIVNEPKFFNAIEWRTSYALCARILPQSDDRPAIWLAAYVDRDMLVRGDTGTRIAPMPYDGEAWRCARAALDVEAWQAYGVKFAALYDENADALLHLMQKDELYEPAWGDVPPKLFFAKRVLVDILAAYYARPTAWSEIGFGRPASPRGYVQDGS